MLMKPGYRAKTTVTGRTRNTTGTSVATWYPYRMAGVAIYARQSLDRTGEALAVSRQLAECRAHAEAHGWTVSAEFVDNDTSASSSKPRPQWSLLLEALAAGTYDVLVCWHTDRLYRRVRDLVDLVEIAERRALRISSVKASDLDLSTPAGRMLAGMLGHAARYEVEQKGARQVAANRARARDGAIGWTRRPFGYHRTGGKGSPVKVHRSEAAEIKRAARRIIAGDTLTAVAADLDARGVTTTTGAPWHISTLKRVLLNPRIAGRAVYCGEDYGPAKAPAILDADTFDRVRAALLDPARRSSPADLSVKYLLSGLARCGRCDAAMYASPSGRGGPMIYKCFASAHMARRLDLVDEVVTATIVARLADPLLTAALRAPVDLHALRAEAVELRDRRDALAAMLADGMLSALSVKTQAGKLTDRIGGLERQIAAATRDDPVAEVADAPDIPAMWRRLPLTKQRRIIDTLAVVRILPQGKGKPFALDAIEIDWRTP